MADADVAAENRESCWMTNKVPIQ